MACSVFSRGADQPLTLHWEKNMLRISGAQVPGDYVEVWYLEAFCRSGSTHQDWNKTTIPHKTELISGSPQKMVLRTTVEPSVVVDHEITSTGDSVHFKLNAKNNGTEFVDVQWFQPCMRVGRFTGKHQNDYIEKSFIFTRDGMKFLHQLPREEEAIYKGGQVYVPAGVPLKDVNPRPISRIQPANSLIGCVSKDDKSLLAMAWNDTQELFQGVIICLHNDPRIGGLKPGESRALTGRIYILPNKPDLLLTRYKSDFAK